jgi:phosphate starvation-inducible PhoH-like protein
VIVSARGNRIFIKGDDDKAEAAKDLLVDIHKLKQDGYNLRPEDIRYAISHLKKNGKSSLRGLFEHSVAVASKAKYIIPKSDNQALYIDAIKDYDIVIGIGPAGTGKTYIAMAMAINAYMTKQFARIVLARPAVEAGEKLGFLPGDMFDKVNPYLRPLHDALYDMMDRDKAGSLIEKGIIEIAPLAFMRGRTLNDAFVILDEAQNTTSEQMKMFLTRLGANSKAVITGDKTQIDLPQGKTSGLIEIQTVLKPIGEIRFVHFTDADVVRHRLVQEIVRAYERFEKRQEETADTTTPEK